MELKPKELRELCQLAQDAALRAGQMIQAQRGASQLLEHKPGAGLAAQIVTQTDRDSQERILETLGPSVRGFDLGLLAEETVDDSSRLAKDHFWCVDPLDGTLPFSEGRPGFAVSIALVSRAGEALVGVVYDPHNKNLYHAIQGQGAFKNGRPLTLPAPASATFSLVVDRSFQEHPEQTGRLTAIRNCLIDNNYPDLQIEQPGGAVMNACYVLEHPPACYLKFPRTERGGGSLWDYAATTVLFQECGANATDFFGGRLDLNRQDSTFMNHRGILFASDPGITRAFAGADLLHP